MNNMNRLIIFLTLVLATSLAQADNYFTMGENDTLRVTVGSDTVTVPVRAHFDGRVSRWTLTMTYPEGLVPLFATAGPDMAVYYLDSTGAECVTEPPIIYNEGLTTIMSAVGEIGYWPQGSGYVAYGPATWEAGDYDEMFYLSLGVSQSFTGGLLNVNGLLTGDDPRGGCVGPGVRFNRMIAVVAVWPTGDINRDGAVNIADVTALISQVLSGTTNAAGDLNGDGTVNIADVTAVITLVLRTTNSAN